MASSAAGEAKACFGSGAGSGSPPSPNPENLNPNPENLNPNPENLNPNPENLNPNPDLNTNTLMSMSTFANLQVDLLDTETTGNEFIAKFQAVSALAHDETVEKSPKIKHQKLIINQRNELEPDTTYFQCVRRWWNNIGRQQINEYLTRELDDYIKYLTMLHKFINVDNTTGQDKSVLMAILGEHVRFLPGLCAGLKTLRVTYTGYQPIADTIDVAVSNLSNLCATVKQNE